MRVFSKDKLRTVIKNCGLTQKKIAEAIGVRESDICRWTSQGDYTVKPGGDKQAAIAAVCGVDVSAFYDDPDAEPKKEMQLKMTPSGIVEVLLNGRRRWATDNPHFLTGQIASYKIILPYVIADLVASLIVDALSQEQGIGLSSLDDAVEAVDIPAKAPQGLAKKKKSCSKPA